MVQTQKFGVTLLVKDLGSKGISKFSFKTTTTMMKAGVNIGTDDMLMNYTHADDMAMNGDTPWRGGREKDPRFFTILLEATSVTGDLILDCTASTSDYPIYKYSTFNVVFCNLVMELSHGSKAFGFHCLQVHAS